MEKGSNSKYSIDGIEKKSFPDIPFFESQDSKSLGQQKLERFGQDTKHRRLLIFWTMIIISVWLLAVLAILVWKSGLSDTVLSTLLATTTVNVLGLAKIILGNLFPKYHNGRKKR